MRRARNALLLAAAFASSGCVYFQVAPTTEFDCDPALVGTWLPRDATPDVAPGTVSDACVLTSLTATGEREEQRFRTFEFEGVRYVAFEQDEANLFKDEHGRVVDEWPKNRLSLFRYRVDGDRVALWDAEADRAFRLAGDGITVRTNLRETFDTAKAAPREWAGQSVYLTGSPEAIGAMLRAHGDPLFADMKEDKAVVLMRVPGPTEATP